jgi:hypothetical protein
MPQLRTLNRQRRRSEKVCKGYSIFLHLYILGKKKSVAQDLLEAVNTTVSVEVEKDTEIANEVLAPKKKKGIHFYLSKHSN